MMRQFDSSNPHVNLGSIGMTGHGKRTLMAAVAWVLSGQSGVATPPGWRVLERVDYVEYETATRYYCHLMATDGRRYMTGLISGTYLIDGLVLVVSLADGLSARTRDELRFARELGVSRVVVFLNKADLVDDAEVIHRAEADVRDLLTECGYAGVDVPVIAGSALMALEGDQSEIGEPAIRRLLEAFDTSIPAPMPDVERPFLMPIEDVFVVTGRGVILSGRVERGVLRVGDMVDVVGRRDVVKSTRVASIEKFRQSHRSTQMSEYAGVILADVDRADVERGQVLCAPGSMQPHTTFEAYVYLLAEAEGGLTEPYDCDAATFYFRTSDFGGRVELPARVDVLRPAEPLRVMCTVRVPVAMEPGLRFGIRRDGRTIGAGIVLRVV